MVTTSKEDMVFKNHGRLHFMNNLSGRYLTNLLPSLCISSISPTPLLEGLQIANAAQ